MGIYSALPDVEPDFLVITKLIGKTKKKIKTQCDAYIA